MKVKTLIMLFVLVAMFMVIPFLFLFNVNKGLLITYVIDPPTSFSYKEPLPFPLPRSVIKSYFLLVADESFRSIKLPSSTSMMGFIVAARRDGDVGDEERNKSIWFVADTALNVGYSVDEKDSCGCTAIDYAYDWGDSELISYLESKGAAYEVDGCPVLVKKTR